MTQTQKPNFSQNYAAPAQQAIILFNPLKQWDEKYRQVIKHAKKLDTLAQDALIEDNKVAGCESQVWLHLQPMNAPNEMLSATSDNPIYIKANSDSKVMCGLIYLLLAALDKQTTNYIQQFDLPLYLADLNMSHHFSESRTNGLRLIFEHIKQRV